MGNTINAALREPAAVTLVDAIAPFDNLRVSEIEAYWRCFYDHAKSFALTRPDLRVICTKAARLVDPHALAGRVIEQADRAFDVFVGNDRVSKDRQEHSAMGAAPTVIDALEFLSAMVFIGAMGIEDKIDLLFDSWDMSEDGALDLDEFTISLKSTLLGLAKILLPKVTVAVADRTTMEATQRARLSYLDDDEIEVLSERMFREIARLSSASLNQISINCDQFRAYCLENKTTRALFDLFDKVESSIAAGNQKDGSITDGDGDILEFMDEGVMLQTKLQKVQEPAPTDASVSTSFPVSANDHGDEFLAVKPWKGAIVAPSRSPSLSKAAPTISMSLAWIFGYNAQDFKNNARFCHTTTGRPETVVYPAAAACVLLNMRTMTQLHYLGHTDDVVSLCLHPKLSIAASGELGKRPKISVWDVQTMETLCVLQGFHQRAILHLAFQGDNTLVTVGGDDDHSIGVYESKDGWRSATLKNHCKGNKAAPLHLAAAAGSTLEFVTCGDKYIEFWCGDSKAMTSKKAVLGKKGAPQPFLVAEFVGSTGTVVVGTNDGSLYLFSGKELISVTKAHQGAVYALHYLSGTLISGGKDGQVVVWDDKIKQVAGPFQIKDSVTGTLPFHGMVRSVCIAADKKSILVGTMASELYEIDTKNGQSLRTDALVKGHFQGETWGLDTHPSKAQCCTVGDDQTLRIWDMESKRELRSVNLDLPARACAYSGDGKLIAVGLGADSAKGGIKASKVKQPSGGFVVYNESDLGKVKEPCFEPKKWVGDIKFSPDNRLLAVASHDTNIYFYDALKGFSKKHAFKKHASYITHIDFSSDGQHLQSTCGAYELLFSDVKTGRHITNASSLRDERWNTMTATLGWPVQGIWEDCSDGTDVNSVDRAKDGSYLATGDDFGKVKIFRYPCAMEKASYVELRGHASHVTKVRWSHDDGFLLSTGGNDRCLFVWRHEKPSKADFQPDISDKKQSSDPPEHGIDLVDSDPLAVIDDVGDEFMAVKPWIGAIVPPSESKGMKFSSSAPEVVVELERVHGYQAQNCANNARYDSQGRVVYHAAALGIVYDKANQRQSFFKHHDDDISAMCAHSNGSVFATAQMGKRPKIYTWNSSNTSNSLSCLEGFHQRFVCAMAFSSDGKKLGSVGGDDDHSIAIYTWENGIVSASAKGERSNVYALGFHAGQWVSCGDKHIRFWREQGKNLTSKKAVFGSTKHKDDKTPGAFECIASFGKYAVIGASNGDLYLFQASNELSRIVRGHSSNLQALYASPSSDELISGGKDGVVMVWDGQFNTITKVDIKELASSLGVLSPGVRSVCSAPGRSGSRAILMGTAGSDLIELDLNRPSSAPHVITRGHCQMEVWGLACHPTRPEYCSGGDDQILRVWCLKTKSQLRCTKLDAMTRTCAIFSNGNTDVIAVGLGGRHAGSSKSNSKAQAKTGAFVLIPFSDVSKRLFEDKPSKQPISEIKFAPSGTTLAVGSHDHNIYVYKITDDFKKVTKCASFTKHQSYITHFDFSADGGILQSNCGAYELLFSEPSTGRHITSASSTKDTKWSSWTCVLGWPVQGIWPPCSDGTDINAVDRSSRGDLLATSDDFGLVKIYRHPCVTKGASAVEGRGHASHVTNVRWSAGDSHVISVGGNDRCVMEWRVKRETDESAVAEIEEEITVESEAEEVEEELEAPEGDEFMAVKPWLGAIVAPSNAPIANAREPDVEMELDWVYGYHTELSKQNLAYNDHGEIVYHTAAVGVIYDPKNHLQRHHSCHNDDIISFTMGPQRNIVATGERGKRPVIRIWDAHTGALRCELKGFHSRGVLSLAFSLDQTKLVSVGDDDDHSVALWEDTSHGSWTQSKLLATAKGDKGLNRFACFGRDATMAITGGVKHVLFWRAEGKTLVSKKGKVGKKGTLQNFPGGCVVGNGELVTGTAGGELYVWMGDELAKAIKAHDGEVTVVHAPPVTTTSASVGLLSGGKDGRVVLWSPAYQALKTFDIGALNPNSVMAKAGICSATLSHPDATRVLVGTATSEILELDVTSGSLLHGGRALIAGHYAGELWGLSVHPARREFATTGDDGTLRIWDMDARRSMATMRLPAKSRACAFSPDGSVVAIGLGAGDTRRRAKKAGGANGATGATSKEGALLLLHRESAKVLLEDRPAKEWISDIKFSPDGRVLAVGSHDNAIYLYNQQGETTFQRRGRPFAKHNSYITHFDFSHDGRYLQSTCGAYELLFCDVTSGEQVRSASSLKDVTWATWTCPLGWPVQGIWPECADGTDVNAACASRSRTILATGEDSGKVKLFRYPCTLKGARAREARGHASHVTSVRFSHDDQFLLSTGGNDRSIFQWKLR